MSRAVIATADVANNSYTVNIAGYGDGLPAQCVTLDELSVGSEIEIVDFDNRAPDKALQWGNLRLLPNTGQYTYSPGKNWKTYEELYLSNKPATLSRAFFYSSEWYNPRWQTECPLYRGGKVISILDAKYMMVEIWSRPISADSSKVTLKCRTDYMECDTQAFAVDDLVIVKFENSCIECPVVVGFWQNPVKCYWEPWGQTLCAYNSWTWTTKSGASTKNGNCADFDQAHYPQAYLSNGVMHLEADSTGLGVNGFAILQTGDAFSDGIYPGNFKIKVSATVVPHATAEAQCYLRVVTQDFSFHWWRFAKQAFMSTPAYVTEQGDNGGAEQTFDLSDHLPSGSLITLIELTSTTLGQGRCYMDIDYFDFPDA